MKQTNGSIRLKQSDQVCRQSAGILRQRSKIMHVFLLLHVIQGLI